ncbi:hypothetical protein MLD38_014475 [Melastoma candidum]|uniref:Uncharacterized protein n=1 Tax=Melastoma candidum TaxID=119954 RepID=A0ACB9RCV4_9MYRT|nr:hypothetical protein MLD38_014475 [Melastoma candidum]
MRVGQDCTQPDYIKMVKALCGEHNVSLINVPSAKTLGEWAGINLFRDIVHRGIRSQRFLFPRVAAAVGDGGGERDAECGRWIGNGGAVPEWGSVKGEVDEDTGDNPGIMDEEMDSAAKKIRYEAWLLRPTK